MNSNDFSKDITTEALYDAKDIQVETTFPQTNSFFCSEDESVDDNRDDFGVVSIVIVRLSWYSSGSWLVRRAMMWLAW